MARKKEEETLPRVRIKLKSFDQKLIDNAARQIVEIGQNFGVEVIGPIPLPTEIHRYTVNRSPFVHKSAREQFEMRIHKRLIEFSKVTPKIVESLQTLNLPSGIDIEIKLK